MWKVWVSNYKTLLWVTVLSQVRPDPYQNIHTPDPQSPWGCFFFIGGKYKVRRESRSLNQQCKIRALTFLIFPLIFSDIGHHPGGDGEMKHRSVGLSHILLTSHKSSAHQRSVQSEVWQRWSGAPGDLCVTAHHLGHGMGAVPTPGAQRRPPSFWLISNLPQCRQLVGGARVSQGQLPALTLSAEATTLCSY